MKIDTQKDAHNMRVYLYLHESLLIRLLGKTQLKRTPQFVAKIIWTRH